ncbi:DUF6878 family protein [Erythrobacter colymbi]|uniref:DUF6878 family protein n=1 Tax=Erythrobacter colymbi TaxID=1161202 RepID=UPI000A3C41EE|nr:DUF6878 family protein [Erythrobacter colymbi]
MTTLAESNTATAARDDAPKLMLAAICACARLHGIATITISYDGCGDEGGIDGVTLSGPALADGEPVPEIAMPDMPCSTWTVPYRGDAVAIESTFESALDDLGYELIAQNHAGWENGEGAFGEVIIDVEAGRATHDHNTRYVSYDSTAYEWEC